MKHAHHPSTRILTLPALLAALLVLAGPAAAQGQAPDGETPPDCEATPPAPPALPAGQRCPPQAAPVAPAPGVAKPWRTPEAYGPTPVGGYTLPKGGFGFKMEFGYPNLDVELLFALGGRVQLGVGYRSVYTLNHTPYADLKISLNSRNRDVLGLALQLTAGYSFGSRDNEDIGNLLAGEYHWFAEAWLRGTARRGRHGLLFGVGGRITQAAYEDYYYDSWDEPSRRKVMGVISLELGYELRINRIASFYLALGVDIFTAEEWIPALPRFRMGVLLGS